MKKIFILCTAAMVFATATLAQTQESKIKNVIANDKKEGSLIKSNEKTERKALRKLEGKEVSYFSKEAFFRDFGNIPIMQWQRTTNFDEATFKKDGHVMKAYYDIDSKLVGTTSNIKFSALPTHAKKIINKDYADYKKLGVVYFDDNEFNQTDMMLYNIQINDEDNYFVELMKGSGKIVLRVDRAGNVYDFAKF